MRLVSLVINSLSLWQDTNYTADVWWQPPARENRHPAQADSDEPDACRADAQVDGRRSGIGVEYETERRRARTKDGAGGGPAEERTCARGRGMRLLKIGAPRTRMRRCESGVTFFLPNQTLMEGIQITLHNDWFR